MEIAEGRWRYRERGVQFRIKDRCPPTTIGDAERTEFAAFINYRLYFAVFSVSLASLINAE
jgi:hypothetical protein